MLSTYLGEAGPGEILRCVIQDITLKNTRYGLPQLNIKPAIAGN